MSSGRRFLLRRNSLRLDLLFFRRCFHCLVFFLFVLRGEFYLSFRGFEGLSLAFLPLFLFFRALLRLFLLFTLGFALVS